MAIDNGIAIDCSALQSTGGIKQICLRSFASGDAVTYSNAAGKHDVTKIVDSGGSTADWKVFEFKTKLLLLILQQLKRMVLLYLSVV